MAEEIKNNEETIQDDSNQMYLDEIQKLKKNTVSLDSYNKLKDENRNLLKTLVEQGQAPAAAEPEKKATAEDIDTMRKELFTKEHNNLEYVEQTLALRKALMENGEMDPFVPKSKHYIPTDDDFASAEQLAAVFQECVDYAEGDSEVFTNELMRRTVDIPLPKMRGRK